MPRKPKKEIAYLTEQEIDAFFRVIRDPRDSALFRVMYHHGLRASEPGKLMLSDFRRGYASCVSKAALPASSTRWWILS